MSVNEAPRIIAAGEADYDDDVVPGDPLFVSVELILSRELGDTERRILRHRLAGMLVHTSSIQLRCRTVELEAMISQISSALTDVSARALELDVQADEQMAMVERALQALNERA